MRKQDFSPTLLDFGVVQFYIARHFGFCYGVENAIEISYRALEENPDKSVFLLSQMIHNQEVNADLQDRGIKFIMDTDGLQFIPWEKIGKDDVVIIPAFGTTLENVDEVRFYISSGGYQGSQAYSNHSINSIKVSSPVLSTSEFGLKTKLKILLKHAFNFLCKYSKLTCIVNIVISHIMLVS